MSWEADFLLLLNRTLAHPFLDALMAMISTLSVPLIALLPVPLLLARKRRAGLTVLAILLLSLLLTVGLQFVLLRPRPVAIRPVLPMPLFPSFPSGHAATAFGVATFAALLRRRWWPLAFLGATVTSFSRVYLGQHYPTDVIGGAILGTAVAAVVYGCFYRPQDGRRPRWAWLLWGQIAIVLLATLSAWLGLLGLDLLMLPGADKVLHFLLFGTLAFLSLGWWVQKPAGVVVAPLALSIVLDEVIQFWGSTRSFDLLDLAASLSGAGLGAWLATLARRLPGRLRGTAGRPPS
jgi:undecaprenyl-diphosphatase